MQRSFDPDRMRQAFKLYPEADNSDVDCGAWLDNSRNVMLIEGDSVGLATYEYPGAYTVHIFCTKRGRDAIDLGERMVGEMFTRHGARILRGLTKKENRKVAWFQRKLGFEYIQDFETTTGPHELFALTYDNFFSRGVTKWAA